MLLWGKMGFSPVACALVLPEVKVKLPATAQPHFSLFMLQFVLNHCLAHYVTCSSNAYVAERKAKYKFN